MYILGISPSTQRTKNRPFQPQKSAAKERRQNILTKLVTKFSTSPLCRPPRQNLPPPRKQTKNPKLSRPSEKHNQNKNSFMRKYSTKFHSTIVKNQSPQLWIFLVYKWKFIWFWLLNTYVVFHTCIACMACIQCIQ